jgi:hypothetical protein
MCRELRRSAWGVGIAMLLAAFALRAEAGCPGDCFAYGPPPNLDLVGDASVGDSFSLSVSDTDIMDLWCWMVCDPPDTGFTRQKEISFTWGRGGVRAVN